MATKDQVLGHLQGMIEGVKMLTGPGDKATVSASGVIKLAQEAIDYIEHLEDVLEEIRNQ